MKIDNLNSWLTLSANVVVILGLAVLIYEVRQNTQALQNETDVAIWSLGSAQASLAVQDADLAHLLIRARTEDWSALDPIEQERLTIFWGMLVDRLELQYRLYTRTDSTLDEGSIVFPEQLLRQPSFRRWWGENSYIYHPEFQTYFEKLLDEARH